MASGRVKVGWCLVSLVLAGPVAAQGPGGPEVEALLADGTRAKGRLSAVRLAAGGAGSIGLASEGGAARDVTLDRLVSAGTGEGVGEPGGPVVLLPGGDRLPGLLRSTDGAEASVERAGGVARVPQDVVLGAVLQPPADPADRVKLLAEIDDPARQGEAIWLGNGDRRTGTIVEVKADAIVFDAGAGPAPLPRAGVLAVGFDRNLLRSAAPGTPHLRIGLADGTRVRCASARTEGDELVLGLVAGGEVRGPLAGLVRLAVLNGPVVALSEREPAAAQYVGFLDRHPRGYGRDRTWDGRPIRLGGVAHESGLGMLPRTLLAYRIEPGDGRFQATIGLDESSGPLGSVAFRVLLDRKEVFASPPMTARSAPMPVDIDLRGARLLVLVVEFAERGDVQDSAVWAEARVLRSEGPVP